MKMIVATMMRKDVATLFAPQLFDELNGAIKSASDGKISQKRLSLYIL